MKKLNIAAVLLSSIFLYSCTTPQKSISNKNKFFEFKENKSDAGYTYEILELRFKQKSLAKIDEKDNFIIIKPKDVKYELDTLSKLPVPQAKVNSAYIDLIDKKYYPEIKNDSISAPSFNYLDVKFGLQALTIPLKFRKSVGNDTLNPPSVETAINVGFAPGWKFTKNIYKKNKNYLGKNTTQLAVAIGPHFGLGTADLKKATNAPGILSDRKAVTFMYGGYLLFGFNNINIGFAVGKDKLIQDGKKNWVYQGKTWTGIIVSLDILKY